jgi:hypothetical protein
MTLPRIVANLDASFKAKKQKTKQTKQTRKKVPQDGTIKGREL